MYRLTSTGIKKLNFCLATSDSASLATHSLKAAKGAKFCDRFKASIKSSQQTVPVVDVADAAL